MVGLDNPVHIAVVLIVLLLVFGAKRIPELGRSLGAGLRGFKDSVSGQDAPAAASSGQDAPAAASLDRRTPAGDNPAEPVGVTWAPRTTANSRDLQTAMPEWSEPSSEACRSSVP